ncbi:MAG: LLM class flavin-dependent oxidoreductase [Candidatus Binatus sp.]|uniref:LLM class flavin-dependent oxidoreductase n=1 Tax=Candidatus Binatus sp. TaxID=2811406 RepID=UPI00271F91C0|nr:LLM class flavin-dependent oxidoreductase [Candidatus Binatus sp.]MDO8434199.1 LLM class flavin-dependent oxidoreductase [Candidatus Binatus sp.]
MAVKFGIFDHLERRDVPLATLYEERLQLIAAADAAGIYCYHLAEHHSTPLGCAPSPGIFLSAVAQRTRRIHLGPLVYLLPLYHPLRLVEEICMLDQMSGGRFEIGVGRGISPFELAHFNVNFLAARDIFEESLKVIVEGLRERRLTHKGEHYRFNAAPIEIHPRQEPNPPFWYGTSTPEGLEFAARHGMNIVAGGPNQVVAGAAQVYREHRERHRDSADNLNPQVKVPMVGAVRHFFAAGTDAEAMEIARPSYKTYYANIVKLWRDHGTVPTMFTDDVELACDHDAAIVGSGATAREKVARYFKETGCNYLVLSFAWGSLTHEQSRRSLDIFVKEVMPAFAE